MINICVRFVLITLVASSSLQQSPNGTVDKNETSQQNLTTKIDNNIVVIKHLAADNLTDINPMQDIGLNPDGTINRDIQRELFIGENELIETLSPEEIIMKFRLLFRKFVFFFSTGKKQKQIEPTPDGFLFFNESGLIMTRTD
jgi:hypothetical protein